MKASSKNRYKLVSVEVKPTNIDRTVMYTRDWRTGLRSPPTYRLGNRTFRFNYHLALLIAAILSIGLIYFYMKSSSPPMYEITKDSVFTQTYYNCTYPLTPPIILRGMQTHRIGMVADMDTLSKSGVIWRSYIKKEYLSFIQSKREVKIIWDDKEPTFLESSFALKDRGMELSELITFDGKLLTFDDRTGLIYESIPWIILLDGDSKTTEGFKWTSSQGEFENENPMFVKIVSPKGEVRSVDWSYSYKALREKSMGIVWPGYMLHESGMWSGVHKKWFFCSKEKYSETRDEHMSCNHLITADEKFSHIESVTLDNRELTHGFSSFKFIQAVMIIIFLL